MQYSEIFIFYFIFFIKCICLHSAL